MEKKLALISVLVFLTGAIFVSCFGDNFDDDFGSEENWETADEFPSEEFYLEDRRVEPSREVSEPANVYFVDSILPSDFDKFVEFIEKKGFPVRERGVYSDFQYTLIDANGNRHAMMTIRRDENGQPSVDGQVKQISVWGYHDGVKSEANFFGYIIYRQEIVSSSPLGLDTQSSKKILAIKGGYYELLRQVSGLTKTKTQ